MSELSPELLDAIEKGCEGVTPGPWLNVNSMERHGMLHCEVRQVDTDPTNKHHWPFRVCHTVPGQYANSDKANFDHIARLDPATVLELVRGYRASHPNTERTGGMSEQSMVELVSRALAKRHGVDPDDLGSGQVHVVNNAGMAAIIADHRGPLWKMWEEDGDYILDKPKGLTI